MYSKNETLLHPDVSPGPARDEGSVAATDLELGRIAAREFVG